MSDYVTELCRLAQHCNYGDMLDMIFGDRIAWGINHEPMQKKLLQVTDLTLMKTLTVAQGFETAEKNLKEMHHAPMAGPTASDSTSSGIQVVNEPVNKVSGKKASSTSENGTRVVCHRCGKPGHLVTVCKFCDSICHKCKMRGHLAQVCRSKSQTPPGRSTKKTTSNSQQVRQVYEESDTDSLDPVMTLQQTQDGCTPPIKVHVQVDGVSIPMEVDTDASVSIKSENRYHSLWPGRDLSTSAIKLQTYSKEPLVLVGSTVVQVVYEGRTLTLPLVVVKGDGPTLLERNW